MLLIRAMWKDWRNWDDLTWDRMAVQRFQENFVSRTFSSQCFPLSPQSAGPRGAILSCLMRGLGQSVALKSQLHVKIT